MEIVLDSFNLEIQMFGPPQEGHIQFWFFIFLLGFGFLLLVVVVVEETSIEKDLIHFAGNQA